MEDTDLDEEGRDETEVAFQRLREVLAAPDRRGWRRYFRREVPSPRTIAAAAEPVPERETDTDSRRPARLAVLLAVPLLGAAAVLTISVFHPSDMPGDLRRSAAPEPAEVERTEAPPSKQPPPAGGDRIWPAEPVSVEGTVVSIGDRRWAVGAPGDVVVVGDWDCDGAPTPAVLRPGDGGFYIFDHWAADGEVAPARRVGSFPGSVSVAAAGCGSALVTSADGTHSRVDTGATRP